MSDGYTVEMPTIAFSACLRALDPCALPPKYLTRDPQNSLRKGDTTFVPRALVLAMIDYLHEMDLIGDPSVGIVDGPVEEYQVLQLAMVGETHCANCDGTGMGVDDDEGHPTICPDCDSSGRQIIEAWKEYWNPTKSVYTARNEISDRWYQK